MPRRSNWDAWHDELDSIEQSTRRNSRNRSRSRRRAIVLNTDASCSDTGQVGLGIYVGPGHPLNRCYRCWNQDSGEAEISAVRNALTNLRDWDGYTDQHVIVRTDYMPLVKAMNRGEGANGRFSDLYDDLQDLAGDLAGNVQFQHVYAHSGDPGNDAADELARKGAGARSRSLSPNKGRDRSKSRDRNQRSRSKW